MKKENLSRKTFWWTVLIILLAVSIMDMAIWAGLTMVGALVTPLVTEGSGLPSVTIAIEGVQRLEHQFLIFGLPGSFILFLILLGAIRLIYRRSVSVSVKKEGPAKGKRATSPDSQAIQAEKKIKEQRLFMHLISVLQREGRLIDFFAEDLDTYEDSQIGAAVRQIHATCRKVVEKSLSLKPVIEKMEGDTVTVNAGFDPSAIKLVGNVTGEPPFEGILRHRGWQAGKIEMPTFSGNQQPGLLAPAEIEIQ